MARGGRLAGAAGHHRPRGLSARDQEHYSSMKLPALRVPTPARRTLGLSVVFSLLASIGCASGGASSTVLADTAFERSLQVDLSSMTKSPSGLYYKDEVEGRGEIAKQRQKVTVRYTGWLPNRTK